MFKDQGSFPSLLPHLRLYSAYEIKWSRWRLKISKPHFSSIVTTTTNHGLRSNIYEISDPYSFTARKKFSFSLTCFKMMPSFRCDMLGNDMIQWKWTMVLPHDIILGKKNTWRRKNILRHSKWRKIGKAWLIRWPYPWWGDVSVKEDSWENFWWMSVDEGLFTTVPMPAVRIKWSSPKTSPIW